MNSAEESSSLKVKVQPNAEQDFRARKISLSSDTAARTCDFIAEKKWIRIAWSVAKLLRESLRAGKEEVVAFCFQTLLDFFVTSVFTV